MRNFWVSRGQLKNTENKDRRKTEMEQSGDIYCTAWIFRGLILMGIWDAGKCLDIFAWNCNGVAEKFPVTHWISHTFHISTPNLLAHTCSRPSGFIFIIRQIWQTQDIPGYDLKFSQAHNETKQLHLYQTQDKDDSSDQTNLVLQTHLFTLGKLFELHIPVCAGWIRRQEGKIIGRQ